MIRSEADKLQFISADEDAEHVLEDFMTGIFSESYSDCVYYKKRLLAFVAVLIIIEVLHLRTLVSPFLKGWHHLEVAQARKPGLIHSSKTQQKRKRFPTLYQVLH